MNAGLKLHSPHPHQPPAPSPRVRYMGQWGWGSPEPEAAGHHLLGRHRRVRVDAAERTAPGLKVAHHHLPGDRPAQDGWVREGREGGGGSTPLRGCPVNT